MRDSQFDNFNETLFIKKIYNLSIFIILNTNISSSSSIRSVGKSCNLILAIANIFVSID